MKVGRIIMIVVGALLALIGFGLLAGSTAGVVTYGTQRTDGYFRTGEVRLASATSAITSNQVDLESEPGDADWLIDRGALGSVRLTIDPGASGTPIFAGIGPTADVAAYLDGVSHDVIRDFELSPDRVLYRRVPGESTPDPPGDQSFWVAQVTAEQADELTWEVDSGDWTVVLMNADGSRGVDLDARLGIKVDWLLPALIGLLALGLVLLAGGAALVIVGSRGQAQPAEPQPAEPLPAEPATWPAPAPPGAAAAPAVAARQVEPYPLVLTGRLDPSLSRGLWLVKWLLALPHYIVLVFLWIAFAIVTVIAFFAIVFTGRYPAGCSTSTSASCGGVGGSATTPTARWAPTATRPSVCNRATTQPSSPSGTRNSSVAGWCSSSGGSWRFPSTWSSAFSVAAGGSAGGNPPRHVGPATAPA